MENYSDIIEEICEHYKVSSCRLAKRAFGKAPAFTYGEVLFRILSNYSLPIEQQFTEFKSRSTISKLLNTLFPGKTNRSQHWSTYLLTCTGKRRCSKCFKILELTSFYGTSNLCIPCEIIKSKTYYINNTEKVNTRNKLYNINNPEVVTLQHKKYYKEHKAETVARTLKYKLAREKATPSWANIELINKIYANKNYDEHVDHIIPIQGELVCGLHCEHNLQYLSIFDNISKSNKFDMDAHIHEMPYL